jgi:hypothetical protein
MENPSGMKLKLPVGLTVDDFLFVFLLREDPPELHMLQSACFRFGIQ